ncbi:DNA-binding transcriptional LysR family regulator [Bosea sp. OAE752]|uniref:LysR family transcriptional regulator n=1 Tax=Bosea sp. OAE752 TaxID=2663873 RepID=UPI003D1A871E
MTIGQRLAFDLRQLAVFCAVVETGSMTRGARQLGLTQSAASQLVAALEKAMGVPLIDRDIRPVRATMAGRLLAERGQELLRQAHELDTAVRLNARDAIPALRIAMIDSLSTTLGPDFIRELRKSFPRYALIANPRELSEQQFNARQIDMIVGVDFLQEVETAMAIPLLAEPFALALPAEWDMEVGKLSDLTGRSMIRYTLRTSTGRQVEQALSRLRLDFPREVESDTAETVLTMVAAGLGWAITTPLMALQARSRLAGVRLLPVPGLSLRRRVDLYARKGELGAIPQEIAAILHTLIQDKLVPELREVAPWIGDGLRVFPQPRG